MMPGSTEWLIILGVALLIFGPSKLPQLGGAIGESIRNFKKGVRDVSSDQVGQSKAPAPKQDPAQK